MQRIVAGEQNTRAGRRVDDAGGRHRAAGVKTENTSGRGHRAVVVERHLKKGRTRTVADVGAVVRDGEGAAETGIVESITGRLVIVESGAGGVGERTAVAAADVAGSPVDGAVVDERRGVEVVVGGGVDREIRPRRHRA